MSFVLVAAAVLVVEAVILMIACFGVEQRDWRYAGEPRGEDEAAPHQRDDVRPGPGLMYAVAALAMVGTGVLSGTDFELSIRTLGVLGVLGVVVPGYAGQSVLLFSTRGLRAPRTGWRGAPAYVLAALGGAAAVAFN
ncbi:hypothetical protein AB0B15_15255 [Streptomyces sp. NPDC045456]|uniref:hypothetical protein n=1 Tax=Streptomyces sp. NPDC045456 TaxID=3155254 RepID=UPI0033EAD0DD